MLKVGDWVKINCVRLYGLNGYAKEYDYIIGTIRQLKSNKYIHPEGWDFVIVDHSGMVGVMEEDVTLLDYYNTNLYKALEGESDATP